MVDRVGQQLGHYRLIRLLGRGGFAEVYLGEHLHLKTEAAIKILHTSLEGEDVERFLREAQMVARLKHPHIVRVFHFDVQEQAPFLVMDYFPNGNVRRAHSRGVPLPMDTIISYIKQVASALQYAHDEQVVHRDIKPENMVLDQGNMLVLTDFGIAVMAQSSRYQSTQEVAGTAAYMAPEQFQGKPRRASDQYAMGVVAYEWLTGDRPFHGSFTEIASQHLFVPPPPLHEKVSRISPEVEQVVLRALEKDPHKRFGSVQEFADALKQASHEDNAILGQKHYNFANDNTAPSLQNHSSRVTQSSTAHSPDVLLSSTVGRHQPQPIIQPRPQARNVSFRSLSQQTRKPTSTKGSRHVTKPPVSKPVNKGPSSISNHRASRITAIVFISFVALVLAVLAFLFFGANATVTISVPSRLLNASAPYEASINRNDTQHNTIPSQVLTYAASVTGQGTATGTAIQGNSIATGTVIFTNRGSQPLDIPHGTIISTSGTGAVQFLTTADVLVYPGNSNHLSAIVPVQAQNPGDTGNVAPNSISIIPPDSLTKIASNNQIPSTSVNLSVTNPNATSGGGAANVQAVSTNDVNTLEKSLHQQLQSQVTTWLAKVVHKGDVQGTLIPSVLGSSTPLLGEKLVTAPAVGQPAAANGKFTAVLSVNIVVLVIRSAAIQAAGRAQLMAAALKEKPVSVLATQLPINATVAKSIPSKDGTTLTIDVAAAGHVVQRVPAQNISNLVAGKGVNQAKSDIMNGGEGINSVIDTRIDIFPPFLGVMPFRPEQIHVIVQPGPVT